MAATRRHRIAQVGTFDLENYGDLLFPLLARRNLGRQLDGAELTLYSYRLKSRKSWVYDVRPLEALLDEIGRFDLVLVGGGDLIRFDKTLAADYEPGDQRLHHPTSIWMAPTMLATQKGIPVAWNAIGVPGEIPAWGRGPLADALAAVDYLSVRDTVSRQRLMELAPGIQVDLVPDTAFGVRELVPKSRSKNLSTLLGELGVGPRYVVLQPSAQLEAYARRLEPPLRALRERGTSILELPIGPVFGDAPGAAGIAVDTVHPAAWPPPELITEIIARSAGAVGVSMHLAIAASAFGVPVALPDELPYSKHKALDGLPGLVRWPASAESPIELGFGEAGGRTAEADQRNREQQSTLLEHWSRTAACIGRPRPQNKLVEAALLALPGQLERGASESAQLAEELETVESDRAELRSQLERLEAERTQVADRSALLSQVEELREHSERLLRDALDQSQKALEREQRIAEQLRASLQRAEADRGSLHEQFAKERGSLQDELSRSASENQRLRDAHSQLERHSEELARSAEASELERARLEELAEALERGASESAQLAEALETADSDRAELRSQLERLEAERAQVADRAAQLSQVEELREHSERLLRDALDESQKALERERHDADQLRASLQRAEADRGSLQDELSRSASENQRLRDAHSQLERHTEGLARSAEATELERARLEELAKALEQDRDRHAERADRLQEQIDSAREQQAASQDQLQSGVHQIEELHAAQRLLVERAEGARADRDHLRVELDALRHQHAELRRIADATEYWLQNLEASRSWRLTAPLRAIAGKWRRTFKKADAGETPAAPETPAP